MDTKRLSNKIEAILNHQVTNEAEAAQVYLGFGCWAEAKGYSGIAGFLFKHAQEERAHMTKVINYILARGGQVDITAIKAPTASPFGLQNCFEQIFKHEVGNTEAIYKIVNLAHDEGDWATFNFVQWFVKEQTEEEELIRNVLDKLKIAGGSKATDGALFNLDKFLGKAPDTATLS